VAGSVGYNPERMPAEPHGWTLISVLFSTIPLEPALAATLHDAALELYRRDESVQQVAGDLVTGRVVNLKKTLQLGSITGPAFEARLDTARGSGTVRYLLTRQGLEREGLPGERPPAGMLH
jgi:hypothetical protein